MAKFIEIKSANVNGIYEVLSNRGVCWQVKGEDGEAFLVQKKQVVRGPWEEDEAEEEQQAAPAPILSGLVAQMVQAKPSPAKPVKKEKEPAADRTDVVTLKELCFELNVIPRIARRRLRKALGQVGTGSRWEWKKDSPELAKVKEALTAKPAAEETTDSDEE